MKKWLNFKDVNFGYLQKDVLHNLSFTINKGETVGIIGGTGAGKSTLVSLIGRNYDVRSGQIKIAGKNIQDYKLETLRQHISYVLQIHHWFQEQLKKIFVCQNLTKKKQWIKL